MTATTKIAAACAIGTDLMAQSEAARARLNLTLDLLDQALDLRELLWCGCGLDDMRTEVDAFKRTVARHKGVTQ